MLCRESGYLGVAVLGDSASAHFEIPEAYLDPYQIDEHTYDELLYVLADEFDRPYMGGYTGFEESATITPVHSFYKKIRERNHCNHRDYQNVGVNGARTSSMQSEIVYTLARNQTLDNPLLLFFSLIGNDVCSGHHDFNEMTTVPNFEKNVLETLNYLDTILPNGSHIVFFGLANGEVLYTTLANRLDIQI